MFENDAQTYRDRMGLLIDNAITGLLLVLIVLGLFLTPKTAFWVMMGIPTALIGGFLLLPLFGVTINMISLFAFIVTIGVVVDDAIMMGEAIFEEQAKGLNGLDAAVAGMRRMAGPVFMAVTTTVLAFMPMFFIPGALGALFGQISAVVVAVLLVSLIEALIILTTHLSHIGEDGPLLRRIGVPQRVLNALLGRFTRTAFRNFVRAALARPTATLSAAVMALLITLSAVAADWLGFAFTPSIQSDTVIAQVTLPYGTPRERSVEIQARLVEEARAVLAVNGMDSPGVFSLIGARLDEGEIEAGTLAGSHYISVLMALPSEEERTLSGTSFATQWRERFGDPGGIEALTFTGETNVTGGESLRYALFHPDTEVGGAAARTLADRMRTVSGLASVDDGVRAGKPEVRLVLNSTGLRLGLDAEELARQVRHRFHGAEALRLSRDGNDIKVMVRLTRAERESMATLRAMLLTTPEGGLVPLSEVARLELGRTETTLSRRDGRRVFTVSADILTGADDDAVEDALEDSLIPSLVAEYPGLEVSTVGEEEEIGESLSALGTGFVLALGGIFVVLALYFNNLTQPLLVLSVIPFSFIGAIWGHIGLGYDLSIVSIIGMIAVSGVVVNNSVVLVGAYCDRRRDGLAHRAAIVEATCARLRPILLTSLTTFCGLAPIMLETSEQAQFLIPMAVSLSFGLIASTAVVLVFVPCLLRLCRPVPIR